MINSNIVEVCRAYAELMCAARRFDRAHESPTRLAASPYALCLFNGAEALLRSAPAEAREHLDTVKKVLEIDQTITTVSVVLLRASLMTMEEGTKRWAMRGDAPSDPRCGQRSGAAQGEAVRLSALWPH